MFLGCCFPSKIENLWCFKPPVPLMGTKNLFSTWNIDMAGYYWKPLPKAFLVLLTSVLKLKSVYFFGKIHPNFGCTTKVMLLHTLKFYAFIFLQKRLYTFEDWYPSPDAFYIGVSFWLLAYESHDLSQIDWDKTNCC